jgi:translation initiation factor 6
LAVYLSSIVGSPSIGVYSLATEKFVIIPKAVPVKKAKRTAEWLQVPLIHTSVNSSVLAGAFTCANSNGIILPNSVLNEELAMFKPFFENNVTVMETRKTAYGNLVLANDFGALVDPRLKEPQIKLISKTLGVEAVPSEIAGLPYVGSLAVATNKGRTKNPRNNTQSASRRGNSQLRNSLRGHRAYSEFTCRSCRFHDDWTRDVYNRECTRCFAG